MIIESHAHYDDSKFDKDRDELLKSLNEKGIDYVINVGANIKSSYASIELANNYDFIYAAVGVHPHDVKDMKDEDLGIIKKLSSKNKVIAIGEIGLDYYYDFSPRDVQKHWFKEQLNLAKELKLPVIVHSRDAAKDTFDILKETRTNEIGGVIHCYSGSAQMALEYSEMGFYIGIGGVVTFKKAQKLIEVVEKVSIDKLLIETDSPYLSPVPNRGKRNDSTNLIYIAEEIAKLKNISYDEVVAKTRDNTIKLFNIG